MENATLANGTAMMKGTRRRVELVTGRALADGGAWRRGEMENLVKRRARPMASGRESKSSRPRVGLAGSRSRRGVRVCSASDRQPNIEKNLDSRAPANKRATFGVSSQEGADPVHKAENQRRAGRASLPRNVSPPKTTTISPNSSCSNVARSFLVL